MIKAMTFICPIHLGDWKGFKSIVECSEHLGEPMLASAFLIFGLGGLAIVLAG